jgi:hypothetical protein
MNLPNPSPLKQSPLKFYYKPNSKYLYLWNELKTKGLVTLPVIESSNNLKSLKKIFIDFKYLDIFFKDYCKSEYGHQLKLSFKLVTKDNKLFLHVNLIDTTNKLNPINFI